MRIGIDIGGTKISSIGLTDGGLPLGDLRTSTPETYGDILQSFVDHIRAIERMANQKVERVGISIAGWINASGRSARTINIPSLNNQPVVDDLSESLRVPVQLANDADCFALSEARDGAGQGFRSVFGLIVGTGVGGNLVVGGKPLSGPNNYCEFGHLPFPWRREDDGPISKCNCGRMGCIETLLSGGGFARTYERLTGHKADGRTIARMAEQNDDSAMSAIEIYADQMARALTLLTTLMDPDVIVIGGSMSRTPRLVERVTDIWKDYDLNGAAPRTILYYARHGADSGVRGAAWL